jgi:plasmid stability protein
MRTTLTLDDDLFKRLRETAHREHRSFKAVCNDAMRDGLDKKPATKRKKITFPTYSMGQPTIDLTKANLIAAEMEDQEIIRKLQLGK